MKKILFISWLSIFSLSTHAFQLPADFESTYLITKYGQTIAKTTFNLKQTDKEITYSSHSVTQGVAAFLSSEKISESSHLLWRQKASQPHLHQYKYKRKKKKHKNQTFTLDWSDNNTATVNGNYGKTTFKIDLKNPVWDRLFVQLALASELQSTGIVKKEYTYSLIDKARLSQYHFEYIADENITIDNSNYDTIKFKRAHASGKRVTYFWLSKKLHYLPVKVEQYRKGKLDLSMALNKINFVGTP
jgi:hypothetical protein